VRVSTGSRFDARTCRPSAQHTTLLTAIRCHDVHIQATVERFVQRSGGRTCGDRRGESQTKRADDVLSAQRHRTTNAAQTAAAKKPTRTRSAAPPALSGDAPVADVSGAGVGVYTGGGVNTGGSVLEPNGADVGGAVPDVDGGGVDGGGVGGEGVDDDVASAVMSTMWSRFIWP